MNFTLSIHLRQLTNFIATKHVRNYDYHFQIPSVNCKMAHFMDNHRVFRKMLKYHEMFYTYQIKILKHHCFGKLDVSSFSEVIPKS